MTMVRSNGAVLGPRDFRSLEYGGITYVIIGQISTI